MSSDAGSIRVSIFNQTYSLRSASGDEHVRRVAQLVDERMRTIASALAVHDVAKVAVLTALNLADELEGLRDFYEKELRELLTRPREEPGEAGPVGDAAAVQEAAEPDTGAEPSEGESIQDEQSWFDSIFDPNTSGKAGEERLSSQVSSRLRSQVSSRLRRLRPPPTTSITEDKSGGE